MITFGDNDWFSASSQPVIRGKGRTRNRVSTRQPERLVSAVLSEMHDEWIAFPRRCLPEDGVTAVHAAERADDTTQALSNTPITRGD